MDKKIKRRMVDYAAYDYPYIQRLLTEQAARGWRFTGLNQGLWEFERSEPAHIRYEVTYAPTESGFNPGPTEQEQTLEELCARVGWVKVASIAQMHIYCNEDPNAVPIETDEGVRLETIRRAMRKNFLPSNWTMLILWLFNLAMQTGMLLTNPTYHLTSGIWVMNCMMITWLEVIYILNLWGYYAWVRRSREAIANGGTCTESGFYRKLRIFLWITILVSLLWMAAELGAVMLALTFGAIFTLILLSIGVKKLLKKLGASANVNRAVTFGFVAIMSFAVVGAVGWGVVRDMDRPEPDVEYYDQGDYDMALYNDDIPIRIEHLRATQDIPYSRHLRWQDESILAGRMECSQQAPIGFEAEELTYEIYDIKFAPVYDLILEDLMDNFRSTADIFFDGNILEPDPSVWKAEKVYHLKEDGWERWIICYPDRIVRFSPNWNLTDPEIAKAAEILTAPELDA